MSTAAYDRLAEVGASVAYGMIPGSKVQVINGPDRGMVLWVTTEAGDLDGAGIVLDPAQAERLRRAVDPQHEQLHHDIAEARAVIAGLQGVITRLRQRGDDLVELLSEARGYVEGYGPTLVDDIDRVLDEAARTAGGADDGLPGRFIGHDHDGGEVYETPTGYRYNAGSPERRSSPEAN